MSDQIKTNKLKDTSERDEFLKSFPSILEDYSKIVLFPHINPDGDCIGATQGLREVIKENFPNKEVYVVGSDYGFFPWMNLKYDVLPVDFDFVNALAIVLDVGTSGRIQCFQEYFGRDRSFGAVVKVDHHGSKPDFDIDLQWDDPKYAACCCQLVQLCDYYGWTVSPKAATCFYLGIATDTGNFTYDCVIPRTFVLSAKARRWGADHGFLMEHLTKRTFSMIALSNEILSNVNKDGHLLWYFLEKSVSSKYKYPDRSYPVAVLNNIEDYKMWILFTEQDDKNISVEFRSNCINVRDIAIEFKGGGHENASGCLISDRKQIQIIVDRAKEIVDVQMKKMAKLQKTTMSFVEDSPLTETISVGAEQILTSNDQNQEAVDLINQIRETYPNNSVKEEPVEEEKPKSKKKPKK